MSNLIAETLNANFFGTYDIRAVVGDNFNAQTYQNVGFAYAHWLLSKLSPDESIPWVAVGHDVRLHSFEFYEALLSGLHAGGISTVNLGMVPSPVAYLTEYLSKEEKSLPPIVGTLVVTASHNPAEYNGLKFTLRGTSFTQEELQDLKAFYQEGRCWNLSPGFDGVATQQMVFDAVGAYKKWTRNQFPGFSTRPKVVVDCGNGTAGILIRDLLEAANCEVIGLFEVPDGHFPNHHPDPCAHKNLIDLQRLVQQEQADLGMAFDGDSDRLGVVDSDGRIIAGDLILILYAQALLAEAPSGTKVVSEVKCSQHLFDQIAQMGGTPIMSRTGHAFIKARMKSEDAMLGGELSGHFFFRDRHFGFDDAFYAALRLIQLLDTVRQQTGLPIRLAHLTSQLPNSYLSEESRIHLDPALQPQVLEALRATLPNYPSFAGLPVISLNTTDGLRVNLDGGFWLIRRSNTEPCFTLRFEAPSPETLEILQETVNNLLAPLLCTQSPHK
jgi:phosphomannomutase/phosphoglucomutase